jgi:DNA-binding IclR family transcriptional regulator
MSYLKDGVEYVTWDEQRILIAVKALNAQGRTTNNSQIASATGLSRGKVSELTGTLRARGYIRDVSRGAAYHWRRTTKLACPEGRSSHA